MGCKVTMPKPAAIVENETISAVDALEIMREVNAL
jgi:hypothetical protein